MPKVQLSDGTQLYYEVKGPALDEEAKLTFVFVHGGPGLLDARSYPYWNRFASKEIRMLFIDQRGSGRSDDPSSADTLNITQHAKDIHEICQARRLNNIIIGGVSQGGYVSISYAAQFPENTMALIVCDSEAKRDTEARINAYQKSLVEFFEVDQEEANRLAELVRKNDKDWDETEYSELASYYSKVGEDFVIARHEQTLKKFFCEEFGTFDLTSILPNITCHVLYMLGEHDCVHPPATARLTRDGMINAASMSYHEIKNAGNDAYVDQEEEVTKLTVNFLRFLLEC